MEAASPARLYAAAVGALLVVLALLGFFYSASFGGLGDYDEALGSLRVNGWVNLFHVATGAAGLVAAGVAARGYALATGLLYLTLAIIGWGTEWVHLAIGLLGLAAAVGTPGQGRQRPAPAGPRNSEPRAKPARQRA